MEEKVNFTLVGLFVLVLGAALVGGVLWLGSGKSLRASYDLYQVYTDDSVAGLNINAPVSYRGVEVGHVRRIALAPDNVEQVQLTLAIEHGTPVKTDTLAVLQTQGLTGLAFVDLAGGSRDAPALRAQAGQAYPVIQSGPSLMKRLDLAVTSLLANLNRSSENFNALMDDDNRKAIKNTLANIAVLSRTLAARSATLDASLDNAAITLENTARLSAELPQLAQRIQRSADAFDQMTNQLARAAEGAHGTLEDTRQFTGTTLPEVQQLVAEMRELTGSLRRLGGELEHNPGALLYGKPAPPRGPGE